MSPEGKAPRLSLAKVGDVGRFTATARLLTQRAWREEFHFLGETMRMDEVVNIIEKVRGRNMEITCRPYKQIVEEEANKTVNFPDGFWLQAEPVHGLARAGEGVIESVHNDLVPQVKPISVEHFVRKFWS